MRIDTVFRAGLQGVLMRATAKQRASQSARPSTSKSTKRDVFLHIRVHASQKKLWKRAAEQQKRSMSSWAALTLDEVARTVLEA